MARKVNVHFRLDEDVKRNMEQACSEMGLSMSVAFTIFAKKVGREKRIPFDISADHLCSEGTINHSEDEAVSHNSRTSY